ncbi:zf-HC2 domain-containing protein [Actinoplanes sp. LDG1-06]|uniref:Zf-HC2 domain-containing protein n=1 Tax=Paractinoplanes ovalisporus TaxID=2810368 RepID=A0ABS2A9R8_9ACTN|nr:zf-HC2 domain-containing protein [Actinoplanes ovalisporus]MBM2616571.1 zf-HC2 domain-containing protein [Actinoplanes ovalisporus]
MSEHDNELLGAYVLGVLEPGERSTVQTHLDGCEQCRKELDELREMEAALGELPPEALIDGPPVDGELLLQRTLKQVRGERTRDDRVRRSVWLAAAAVVAVAVLGGGALLGRGTAPGQPVIEANPAVTLPADARTASAADAATGARMTVAVIPAAGWVRVHAEVSGVAAGQQCRLYVIGKDGSRREAGSWLISEKAAAEGGSVDGSALIAPDEVASVQVETFAGQPLVNVPV